MTLAEKIYNTFYNKNAFSLNDAYNKNKDKPKETIRARIYENLGVKFERLTKGVYRTLDGKGSLLLLEGDGRDLSMLEDGSVDCIITDHPWYDPKSHRGGDRHFANYECFRYNLSDFKEKARVLKDGSFLVEVIPAENESNYKYLYELKEYAEKAGLLYYAKVTWKKGTFVGNTGRKAKNSQDIMIFSKGKARNLRIDVKKTRNTGVESYMSGTRGMLPTMFDVQPVSKNERIHQSELPVELCEQIISYVTLEGEIILDQFAGSGAVGEAALNTGRSCILIELMKENILKIKNRLNSRFLECVC